ncbi:MAG: hypothetical protein U0Q47_00385 [Mycobacterium sp.]
MIAWQDQGLIRGHVLDIGCGLGDNAGTEMAFWLVVAERASVDSPR